MNRQQAKEILILYRPRGGGLPDPEVGEALALAESDAELARWFEQHRAFQAALQDKFRQIPVPEGLEEQILSERKVQTATFLRRPAVRLALAFALILLFAGLAVVWLQPHEDKTFSGFRQRIGQTVARQYPRMDLETNDLDQIHQFLAQRGHGDYVLPKGLEKTASTGCALLTWQGRPVTMICFNSGKTPKAAAPDLFLFVVARADVPKAPVAGAPQFDQTGRLATASWTQGDRTYMLGTIGDAELLRPYL